MPVARCPICAIANPTAQICGRCLVRPPHYDRVVVPFTISCGKCFFCQKTLFSCCDTSNPNAKIAEKAMGHSPAGLFGFSHMLGGFAGGQAEYLRVPDRKSVV